MLTEFGFFKVLRSLAHYLAVLFLLAFALSSGVAASTISTCCSNITVTVDSNGAYSVTAQGPQWVLAGGIGRPLANITVNSGADNIGDYQEIDFNYSVDAPAVGRELQATPRQAGIRAYEEKPVVLFVVQYVDAATNTARFPDLTIYPQGLFHLTYQGIFGHYDFHLLGNDNPSASRTLEYVNDDFAVGPDSRTHGPARLLLGSRPEPAKSLPRRLHRAAEFRRHFYFVQSDQ